MTSPRRPEGRGRVLGVDVGAVRVGLAVSDETRTVASPLATLERTSRDLWARLRGEVATRDVRCAVVGLPRRLDGSEGDSAADARRFADALGAELGVEVDLWDERFTTAQAEREMISAGVRRDKRRRSIDAVAAALLLQSWLDAHRDRAP
ncbi:MAG: Holliday junction resolvase RuvX [Candidatus Dormibacteraeota bacterium]|nr:Holliday junction resolvase RuvX [Candidatus Dormibacteraeota bacterium]MBV9526329.1 Holliday junction resolvase RuvX [Candidatus Dormibacteraeota bacterium]